MKSQIYQITETLIKAKWDNEEEKARMIETLTIIDEKGLRLNIVSVLPLIGALAKYSNTIVYPVLKTRMKKIYGADASEVSIRKHLVVIRGVLNGKN